MNASTATNAPSRDLVQERICDCFEGIREQNPGKRILLVVDNFFSHTWVSTRKRASQLGIDLVILPVGSPDLNSIEFVWKGLKWEISLLIIESTEGFRVLVGPVFKKLTDRVSFAGN